ncbi:MAG: N-acetyltransferase [Opitutaceae bacterium]
MNPDTSALSVTRNRTLRRFEVRIDEDGATLNYTGGRGSISFDHTDVLDALRGKGLAAALVQAALQEARQEQWPFVLRCTVPAGFIARNPDFADLVRPERSQIL